MNVISKSNLFRAARETGNDQLMNKVTRWYEVALRARFGSFKEVQHLFPSADWVDGLIVFNLGAYRLICGPSFHRQRFYFKALLTHAEYDRGAWRIK